MAATGAARAAAARLFLMLNRSNPKISIEQFEACLEIVEQTAEGQDAIKFWDESLQKIHGRYARLHAAAFYLLQWLPPDPTKAASMARAAEVIKARERLKLLLEFGWDQ